MERRYCYVEIYRSKTLLGNLDSTDPNFNYSLSRPWLHWSFCIQKYTSYRWNPFGWTQRFLWCPWRGHCWITQLHCPDTESWTNYTEWLVPRKSSRQLIPDISCRGLQWWKGGCSQYGRYYALYSSLITSPIVLGLHQLQIVLFELRD